MENVPKKTPYRDPVIKGAIIEAQKEIFHVPEIPSRVASDFFGLESVELIDTELQDFSIFVEYASKRLVNANLVSHVEPLSGNIRAKALKKIDEIIMDTSGIAFHDIAHCIAMVAKKEADNSITPSFVKESNVVNNKKVIEEEALALLWENVFGKYPLFVYFLRPDLKQEIIDSYMRKFANRPDRQNGEIKEFMRAISDAMDSIDYQSFDSVFTAYQKVVYLTTKKINRRIYLNQYKGDVDVALDVDQINQEYDTITDDLMRYPDKTLITIARRVFENYPSNPKILFDEFKRICGPLIERLKKRSL